MEKNLLELEAFEIQQPIGKFYFAKMDYKDLIYLASKDMDDIFNDKDAVLQRKLDKARIPALKKYMEYNNATFPNGIILNAQKDACMNYSNNKLTISRIKNAFFIIDGQHRIEALKNYYGEKKFELGVVIFDHVSLDVQSEIFATVNGEQKAVNPTIRLNMKGNDSVDTPDKVVRDICILLNKNRTSPFYKMIKVDDLGKGIISMWAVSSPILSYIYDSSDYYNIKDYLLLNDNNRLDLIGMYNYSEYDKVLWKMYAKKADNVMYRMIANYFTIIKDIYSKTKYVTYVDGKKVITEINQWNNSKYILCKTTGYNALIKLLKVLIQTKCNNNFTEYNFSKILEPLNCEYDKLFVQNEFGSGLYASQRLYEFLYNIVIGDEECGLFSSLDFDKFVIED